MDWIAGIGDSLWFLIVAFVAAAVVALALTPVVRTVALRLGMVDVPEHRRVNDRPVPRAGGVAVMAAFVAVGPIVVWVNDAAGIVPVPLFLDGPELIALFAGGVAAALLGVIDDYLQVRARWQLAGQLLLALWAVGIGIGVDSLYDPLTDGPLRLVGPLSIVFTTFWIVGMINAINFIDGLDGLSSGIGFIAALALGLISLTVTVGQPFITLLCLVLAGALLGFLRWNFHPASIFAGTSGTMFLGYTLALLSILGTAKVAVALLVLGVPIIDTFWIIVRRLVQGRAPFSPDRGHIHHRLLDLGLSHRQAVLVIYGICGGLAVLSLVLSGTGQFYAFLGLFVILGLALFLLARRSLVAEELTATAYENGAGSAPPGGTTDGSPGERA